MVASIPNDVFQFSTWTAVQKGFSTGQPRAADLTSHGTDGIGVFEDGKLMILTDSEAFSIAENGKLSSAQLHKRLCFAMVTIFQPMRVINDFRLDNRTLYEVLSSVEKVPGVGGQNSVLPLKVGGTFVGLRVEGPGGSIIEREKIKGTMFGYRVPDWMEGISGPGLHCHFVSEEKGGEGGLGGRVLSFEELKDAWVLVGKCGRFHLGFPQGEDWEAFELS